MADNIIKKRAYEKIYTFTLVLYLVWSVIFGLTNWNHEALFGIEPIINKLLLYLIIFLLIFIVFMDLFSRRGLRLKARHIIFFIIMILLYLSYRNTKNTMLLFACVFITLGYGISFEKLIKIYYKTLLFILLTEIILLILGQSINEIIDFQYAIGYSFGMYHPNNFAILIMSIVFAWGAEKAEVKSYLVASTSICIGVGVYFLTASRTSSICIISFGILILIYKLLKVCSIQKILYCLRITVVIVVVLTIYLTIFYNVGNQKIFGSDNNFIVRFTSGYNVYKEYGISLFGEGIPLINIELANTLGIQATVLDSAYVSLLLNHGLIALLLFFIYENIICKYLIRSQKYVILIITVIYLIAGFMEQSVMMIQFNFTLFAGVTLLNGNSIEHRNVRERRYK